MSVAIGDMVGGRRVVFVLGPEERTEVLHQALGGGESERVCVFVTARADAPPPAERLVKNFGVL